MYDESSNEQYFMHEIEEVNECVVFIRMDVTVLDSNYYVLMQGRSG